MAKTFETIIFTAEHIHLPTQPPTFSGTRNEYQPKGGKALQLGRKDRYDSFHLWINVWVTGKTV